MTVVLDDIVTKFSDRIDSHRSSWPRIQRCMVEDYLRAHNDQREVVIAFDDEQATIRDNETSWLVSHPMEFGGDVFNLFGGWNADVARRVRRLLRHEGPLLTLEREIPSIRDILKGRDEKLEQRQFTDDEWDELERFRSAPVLTHARLTAPNFDTLVIGDSHSNARYARGRLVARNDGLTLHGMLKRGLAEMIHTVDVPYHEKPFNLIVVIGNIDIRHHLFRHDDPFIAAETMLEQLHRQCLELLVSGAIASAQLTMPYPIEHEGRRIPQTGFYKKTPFFGTRDQRLALVQHWIDTASDLFDTHELMVYRWPDERYEMDGEEYAKEFMERPGSVHLSPRHYPEWDLINNKPKETTT